MPSADKCSTKPQGKNEVKKALIEASITLFSEYGIKAVTIRDIAGAANVNPSLIYRHFGNRDRLVNAVIRSLFSRMEPLAVEPGDSGEEMLMQSFQMIRKHPEIFRIFAFLALEKQGHLFRGLRSPYFQDVVSTIEQSQKDGTLYPLLDAKLLLACSYAMGLGWHIFRPMLIELAGLNTDDKLSPRQIERFWFDLLAVDNNKT